MSCEYCKKPYGKDITIKRGCATGSIPQCVELITHEDDNPGMVLWNYGAANGYFEVNFCPMCGKSLKESKEDKQK